MRVAEGNNAQRPEAAEHGEDSQAQVVPRRKHQEIVLALALTGAVTLQEDTGTGCLITALEYPSVWRPKQSFGRFLFFALTRERKSIQLTSH